MAKKPPPLPLRCVVWSGCKLLIFFSVLLCFLAFLRLRSQPETPRAARVSFSSFEGLPKIAFLFLVRRNIPLDFLWGAFFQNGDVGRFSVYVHAEPGFVLDKSTSRSHFFYGRQLKNSMKVAWGESSMIQAERLLLEAALEDPSNQRFVLLSDSCVPLYSFSYVYEYLMASSRSFVDSFLDTIEDSRYNPKMSPVIPKIKWRKGSQWFSLVRGHAEVLVDDEVIFPVFGKHCKRRPPIDPTKGKQNILLQKQHNCIPDEHYVPTLLAMSDLEDELERRTVTYTFWNPSASKMEKKGWHPITFDYEDASPEKINEIKAINHVFYKTETRTEWCKTNSTFVSCFLFARKFSKPAATRLLKDGVVGPFDASAID